MKLEAPPAAPHVQNTPCQKVGLFWKTQTGAGRPLYANGDSKANDSMTCILGNWISWPRVTWNTSLYVSWAHVAPHGTFLHIMARVLLMSKISSFGRCFMCLLKKTKHVLNQGRGVAAAVADKKAPAETWAKGSPYFCDMLREVCCYRPYRL